MASDNPQSGNVVWSLRPIGGGKYEATLVFSTSAPGVDLPPSKVIAHGANPQAAVHRAAMLADQITSSPIFQAVAPPGTAAAVKAIKMIAGSKSVQQVATKFVGPGAKRLFKAIGF